MQHTSENGMPRARKTVLCIAIGVAGVFAVVLCYRHAYSNRATATHVGIKMCRKCHESDGIGNQYKIWSGTPHAKAYQVLAPNNPRAAEYGKKVGVANPQEDVRCLRCHTTGGGRASETREEGVGCEACHGPGSLYFEFSNHASFDNREAAYRKAVRLGMYPIIGIEGIKAREKLCLHCHRDERPCYPESVEEQKRQRLSLSIIANFIYRHPIRR